MSLVLNSLSSILINETEELNQDSLNPKIAILVSNDKMIYNSFGNTVGRWHCYWYFDSNIKGYSKGDLVWLNVEDPYSFVQSHYETIKNYTDLRADVLTKLPDFVAQDDEIVEKYLNALSGYTDSKSGNVKPLEPIFDLGNFEKPIQLAVSLLDNNKKLVSDETGWRKLFVDDDSAEKKIFETILEAKKKILERHLIDYHLSGQEEKVEAQLSDYLDLPESAIDYDSAPEGWYADHTKKNSSPYGLDYSTYFVKKPFLLSGTVSQYQAVRYWKSGLIEHFGTIATDNDEFSLSNGQYLRIPLDWKFVDGESGAKAYERGELADSMLQVLSAFETKDSVVPPKDNLINVLVERSDITVDGLDRAKAFKNKDYNVAISPVFQTVDGISQNYIDANYGESSFKQDWNSNFLANELIEEMKLESSFALRLDTRTLAPYISYYAVGIGEDKNG